MSDDTTTRRGLLKWLPPAILTLPVFPSFARSGSNDAVEEDHHKSHKKKETPKAVEWRAQVNDERETR